jgi:hypothetical protein
MSDRNERWGDLLRRGLGGDATAYAAFLTGITPVLRNIVRARTVVSVVVWLYVDYC